MTANAALRGDSGLIAGVTPSAMQRRKLKTGSSALAAPIEAPNVELSGPTAALSPEGPAQTQGSASD